MHDKAAMQNKNFMKDFSQNENSKKEKNKAYMSFESWNNVLARHKKEALQ